MLATALIAFFAPLGEELLFRGVISTVLLRYGAVIGVGGGALIFALFHEVNMVFPAALVAGLAATTLDPEVRTGRSWSWS